jgi:serine/threonine-protein kinase RsbW
MPTGAEGLLVSSDLSELARMAAWIDAWASSQQLPAPVTERLHLCSTEAVTNVIMHAYADGASHPISLTLRKEGETVALEIEDAGSPFDPRERPRPQPATDLQDARIGGWGIPIMRRFSDEMHYRRAGTRNVLTFVFRLPPIGLN